MNKLLVPIVIVVLIALLGGGYLLSKRQSSTTTGTVGQDVEEQKQTGSGESFFGSMTDLLKRNTAMKCTAVSDEDTAATSGTYYIDPGTKRARIDMEITTETDENALTLVSHVITDEEYMYSWQEGQQTGMKISTKTEVTAESAGVTGAAPSESQADLEKELNFNCSPWSLDESVFTLPSDVTFQDLTASMQQFTAPSGAGDENVDVNALMEQYGQAE